MKDETKDAIRKGFFDWVTDNPEIVARLFWFVAGFGLGILVAF